MSLDDVSLNSPNEQSDSSSVTGSLHSEVESVSLAHFVISNLSADVSKVDEDVAISDTGTIIVARSHFGCFIKPVNRLLHTMSRQDAVSMPSHRIQTF